MSEGKWQVDHIMPASFKLKRNQQERCCHWTNLQSSLAKDRARPPGTKIIGKKSAKITCERHWVDSTTGWVCSVKKTKNVHKMQ